VTSTIGNLYHCEDIMQHMYQNMKATARVDFARRRT
jgi:hypothetical protein